MIFVSVRQLDVLVDDVAVYKHDLVIDFPVHLKITTTHLTHADNLVRAASPLLVKKSFTASI